jgi:hypothetical protein
MRKFLEKLLGSSEPPKQPGPSSVPDWQWPGYIAGNIQFVIEEFGWPVLKTTAVVVRRSDNGLHFRCSETQLLPDLTDKTDLRAHCYLKDCDGFDGLMAMFAIDPRERNEDILRMPVDLLVRAAARRLGTLLKQTH